MKSLILDIAGGGGVAGLATGGARIHPSGAWLAVGVALLVVAVVGAK